MSAPKGAQVWNTARKGLYFWRNRKMPAITDFQNTAAKLSAAQAALPALQSAVTSASNAVENARTTIASMETQIATANANLKTAKTTLASQLVAGSDTTATIASINSLQTQISGFSDAKAILNQQLTQLRQR